MARGYFGKKKWKLNKQSTCSENTDSDSHSYLFKGRKNSLKNIFKPNVRSDGYGPTDTSHSDDDGYWPSPGDKRTMNKIMPNVCSNDYPLMDTIASSSTSIYSDAVSNRGSMSNTDPDNDNNLSSLPCNGYEQIRKIQEQSTKWWWSDSWIPPDQPTGAALAPLSPPAAAKPIFKSNKYNPGGGKLRAKRKRRKRGTTGKTKRLKETEKKVRGEGGRRKTGVGFGFGFFGSFLELCRRRSEKVFDPPVRLYKLS